MIVMAPVPTGAGFGLKPVARGGCVTSGSVRLRGGAAVHGRDADLPGSRPERHREPELQSACARLNQAPPARLSSPLFTVGFTAARRFIPDTAMTVALPPTAVSGVKPVIVGATRKCYPVLPSRTWLPSVTVYRSGSPRPAGTVHPERRRRAVGVLIAARTGSRPR